MSLDCEEAHADIAGMASSSYFLHLAKAEVQAAFWLVINFYVSWILHSEMVLAMLANDWDSWPDYRTGSRPARSRRVV